MAVTDLQPAHGTIRNSSNYVMPWYMYCTVWTHSHVPQSHTHTLPHIPIHTHTHTPEHPHTHTDIPHSLTHMHIYTHSDIHSLTLTHVHTLILTICRYGTGIEPVRPSSCLANHHSSSSLRSTVILSPFLKLRSSGSSCHTTHTAERGVTAAFPSSFTVTLLRSRRPSLVQCCPRAS